MCITNGCFCLDLPMVFSNYFLEWHYIDVIMGTIASQITSLTIVYSTVYSDADQKKISKLRVTGLCAVNSPETGEFPAQRTSNAENVSIWWRHHEKGLYHVCFEFHHNFSIDNKPALCQIKVKYLIFSKVLRCNHWSLVFVVKLLGLLRRFYIEGILPKGPYLPCVSMASRALLAGYHITYISHILLLTVL